MKTATFILFPNSMLSDPEMYPNLGMQYVAASLDREGVEIQWANLRSHHGIEIDCIPPGDFICVGATSGESGFAKEIARLCKSRDPYCVTIVGGTHASIMPEDYAGFFDIIVVGEGEKVILEALKGARGVLRSQRLRDLDSLPFPLRPDWVFSYTLMPGERYGKGAKATSLISSRGCSYSCHFCANIHHNPVVYRSPENVVEEVKVLVEKYGCRNFRDSSDTLTLNKKWLFRLCELLAPLKVIWKGHTRSDCIDDAVCEALKASGFVEMGIGVESADQKVLNLVNKREKVEDHYKAIICLERHRIMAKTYFMGGLPGETEETIRLNKEFLIATQPSKITICLFCPHPGSEIWRNPTRFGITIQDRDFSHYWNWPEKAIHLLDGLTAEQQMERYTRFFNFMVREEWRK